MLEDFLSYIESNLSIFNTDKLLLSVSGGVDSMVMFHLFRMLDYDISVAHINHSTRDGASDDDMLFVESVCKIYDVPFFSRTLDYNLLTKGNFQETARIERFKFLHLLKSEHSFKWIVTAHHKEDRWETFLMNLNRKSGLKGLTSLKAIHNSILHPLLIFTKDEIYEFAKSHNFDFVHDVSNDTNDYLRNAVRNKITPIANDVFTNFIPNVNQSIDHLENEFGLLKELISKNDLMYTEKLTGNMLIDLNKIQAFNNSSTLLYHMIEKYGFNYSDVNDILNSMATGSLFYSSEFEALIDRGTLIIRKRKDKKTTSITIHGLGSFTLPDERVLIVSQNNIEETDPELWLDFDKVKWPLVVRNIEPGDKFKPAGMKGATKTIKKLCSDLKISRFEKDALLVACEKETIVQVIGVKTSFNYIASDIKNAVTFKIVQ